MTKTDIYTRVTDRIIADLETGVRPWLKPWTASEGTGRITLPLRHNGTPYQGINILLLWGEAMERGYDSSTWMTFKQALDYGAHIRKGEKGSLVVYADRFRKTEQDAHGNDIERDIPFLKSYTVFNVAQIEGLPERFNAQPLPQSDVGMNERAERFFDATGATVRHGGNWAYYAMAPDVVQLPPSGAFKDAESYFSTAAHEFIHWTKHPSRLARDFAAKRFGDSGYAREELVAEIGAAFLCAALDITPETREDHAAYIGDWLRVLREDKRAIFNAASYAQRAVEYLMQRQRKELL